MPGQLKLPSLQHSVMSVMTFASYTNGKVAAAMAASWLKQAEGGTLTELMTDKQPCMAQLTGQAAGSCPA